MKVVVKSPLRDTIAFILTLKKRKRLFKRGASTPLGPAPMNLLAASLHPRRQVLRVASVRQETPSTRTFRLEPAGESSHVAVFRAGQYIAVEESVDGTPVSRPFSISSTPDDAAEGNFYDITIKAGEEGYFAPWTQREWKTGTVLTCSEPAGTFYYEALRDARHIVCLAGGSGITPFRSILLDSLHNVPDLRFTLLYGATGPEELIFGPELTKLQQEYPERFSMVTVFSEDSETAGNIGGHAPKTGDLYQHVESGFITADLIRKYVPELQPDVGGTNAGQPAAGHTDSSRPGFFICGPPGMYDFVTRELKAFSLTPRRLRKENYGRSSIDTAGSGSDSAAGSAVTPAATAPAAQDQWKITVLESSPACSEGTERILPADPGETVLTSLERAGLNPPALCRSGECGWCRSRLVSGEIHVPPENDSRRKADLKFGWFHPCSSYPRSDLVIEVPRNPIKGR